MKIGTHLIAGLLAATPALAWAGNDTCPVTFNRQILDGRLYVYNADGKGRWDFVASRYDMPDRNLLFAYGIKDERQNTGGMVLFKIVDIAKTANGGASNNILDREVQLSRNAVKRYVRWRGLSTRKAMRGHVDVQTYQDIHLNERDISGTLNSFHTRYRFDAQTNRDTFDKLRRDVFAFEQVKAINAQRSLLDILLATPAWADVRSDDVITSLRAALKYYDQPDPARGEAICFTHRPTGQALRTLITAVDLDFPGPYSDQDEALRGRTPAAKWTLRWNPPQAEEE